MTVNPTLVAGEAERSLFYRAQECCTCTSLMGIVQREDESFWTDCQNRMFMQHSTPSSTPPQASTTPSSTPNSATPTTTMIDADQDDMVFFVRKVFSKTPSTSTSSSTSIALVPDGEFFVRRRNSKNMPTLTDSTIDWERSCLLNVLTHSLQFTMTVLLCHNPSEDTTKDFTTLKKVCKTVYASPLKVGITNSSKKETKQQIGYPILFFTIVDFDDAFSDMVIDSPGQFIAVDLSASGDLFGITAHSVSLFCGGLTYKVITKAYMDKGSWTFFGDKIGQTLPSLLSPILLPGIKPQQQRFIEVKGPGKKGFVQIGFEPVPSASLREAEEKHKSNPFSPPPIPKELKCMPAYLGLRYDVMIHDLFRKVTDSMVQSKIPSSPATLSPLPQSQSQSQQTRK